MQTVFFYPFAAQEAIILVWNLSHSDVRGFALSISF
jgi:hypothetical protein